MPSLLGLQWLTSQVCYHLMNLTVRDASMSHQRLSWTYQVSDGSRTARGGCAASAGIAVNLISRPVCDHQRF